MLRQLLVGATVSVCNILIHALIMAIVVGVARKVSFQNTRHATLRLSYVMIAVISVLMAAHTTEVAVWMLAYSITDATPDSAPLYFAFVNYTTLGYGDVVPRPEWQLLGPMTAMNGVILFGWSTAVIFEVLRRATSNFQN